MSSETLEIEEPARVHPAANAWISVVRTYNLCSAAILRGIAPFGMNLTQHEVLINLLLRPGLSQQELASRCFSAKSGISAIVNGFEKAGLLTRLDDRDDARKKLLYLTQEGKEQASRNLKIQNKVISSMVETYDQEELDELENKMNQTSEILTRLFA